MLLTGEKPIPLGQLGAHDDFAKFETERVSGVNLGGENWRLDAIEDAVRNVALLFRTFDSRTAISQFEAAIGDLGGDSGNDMEFAFLHKAVACGIVEGHQLLLYVVHALS